MRPFGKSKRRGNNKLNAFLRVACSAWVCGPFLSAKIARNERPDYNTLFKNYKNHLAQKPLEPAQKLCYLFIYLGKAGLSIEEAAKEIARIKQHFILKPENETLFEEWEKIVETYRVSGKQVYDARIVAAMRTHKVERLLTFNVADFQRYASLVMVVAPQEIVSAP